MSYAVFLTGEALEDLQRLESHMIELALEQSDLELPERAMAVIRDNLRLLEINPFTCRMVGDHPYERELVIPFGKAGYLAFFEIVSEDRVLVGAIRHQREEDYR